MPSFTALTPILWGEIQQAGHSWILLSIRIGIPLSMIPIFGASYIPRSIRLLFIATIALAISWGNRAHIGHINNNVWQSAFTEVALGSVLGLSILIAFAFISLAGRLIDTMIGFGMAQVIDPVTKRQIPIVNSILDLVATFVFLLLDGHHALLRVILYSIEKFPIGQPWPMNATIEIVIIQLTNQTIFGFMLVAPIVATVLLVEAALGTIARSLPQINMLIIGIPIKITAGLLVLGLVAYSMAPSLQRIYNEINRGWGLLLFQNNVGPT
ncbi:flagellar biosynthetic protein FliR [Acidovorax facilis]|uniref:flagellar biosynthetic protein FliR n=1 Tax=Acidovorax facilis TaxID=12917 RepID=UPI003CECFFFC